MLSYTKNTSERITLKVNVFVIPNRVSSIDKELFMDFQKLAHVDQMCAMNGTSLNKTDHLVQIWWTSQDCDNWEDHHPRIKFDGSDWEFRMATYDLPYEVVHDWKEGEAVSLKMPVKLYSIDNPAITREITADLEIIPVQLEYRYKRFGKFEQAADAVCV